MAQIVLTTLNARYSHTAFGLRCLLANLGPLREQTNLLEFELNANPRIVVEKILAKNPVIVGFSVAIWNVSKLTEMVSLLSVLRPQITIVLGGPEVSYTLDGLAIVQYADYIIQGEGELAFYKLCQKLLAGEKPEQRVIVAELPQLTDLVLPYQEYSDQDVAHRVIYVEASRGCPFNCEFCLSSLTEHVRYVDQSLFLIEIKKLLISFFN